MSRASRSWLALAALGPLAIAACSGAPADSRIGLVTPDESQFPPVADRLARHCGSLDCHGSPQRNFILWSCQGLRLNPNDRTGCVHMGGSPKIYKETTPDEYAATFRSLVALEPQVMSTVVAGHGQLPELLTFVRKARGDESHKGGKVFTAGDDYDRCIAAWLAGNADDEGTYCGKAADADKQGELSQEPSDDGGSP